MILGHPASISNPFFLLAPGWARLPMVFLATVATVIASQAVITGAFSVAHQAGRLGYLPRLRIQYTSEQMMGQIYVPWINWLLLVAVLTLVLAFRTSAALAYAYGTAVTGTITITTLLFFYYARHQWRWPLWIVLAGGGVLIVIDLLFFAANLTKVTHGAWFPLLIGLIAFATFTTWQRGHELVTVQRHRAEGPLTEFMEQLHAMKPPLHRVPGTAVFLNRGKATAPLAMRANVEHNEILHEHVVILSVETMPVPHVPAEERLQIDDLGYEADRIIHVTACFGLGPRRRRPTAESRLSCCATCSTKTVHGQQGPARPQRANAEIQHLLEVAVPEVVLDLGEHDQIETPGRPLLRDLAPLDQDVRQVAGAPGGLDRAGGHVAGQQAVTAPGEHRRQHADGAVSTPMVHPGSKALRYRRSG